MVKKKTIYDKTSYSELVSLKKKLKGSKIVKVSWWDGWRYALNDKRGYRLHIR